MGEKVGGGRSKRKRGSSVIERGGKIEVKGREEGDGGEEKEGGEGEREEQHVQAKSTGEREGWTRGELDGMEGKGVRGGGGAGGGAGRGRWGKRRGRERRKKGVVEGGS